MKKIKTQVLTEAAAAVAAALVLSFIKIIQMPQGGSVSLAMIPLFIIAIRRGAPVGIASGAVYGLISLAIDGQIFHPLSILLDYVLAFGLLGISGLFPKKLSGIIFGIISGVGLRFSSSLVSGAVLFAEYAPQGQNVWAYSAIYQASYLIPELVISVVIIGLFYIKFPRFFEVV